MQNSLKEHREIRNFTQEELANASGISIRTIQRIEKGLSKGSPYTLRMLADTLCIRVEEIIFNDSRQELGNLDKMRLLNLSTLLGLFIPFGNIIFPSCLFWKFKADKAIKNYGLNLIGHQIMATGILIPLLAILFIIIGRGQGAIPLPFLIIYMIYALMTLSYIFHTVYKLERSELPLAFLPRIL